MNLFHIPLKLQLEGPGPTGILCSLYLPCKAGGCHFYPPAGRHQLHAVPLPCFRALTFSGGELLRTSSALVFVAASKGTPLDCWAQQARAASIPELHGTLTLRPFLEDCHPQDTVQIADC